ncbi:MAG: class II fructose-bisphosphate aldolase [Actinobacteria bacterium]|nr:class II fructose-bisphosphate aldolase [Actinomycetota bacterium]
MLVNFNYLLKEAIRNDYAVGIMEVWDLHTIKAGVEAAVEENSPAALLAGQTFIEGIGIKAFADIALSYINSVDVPIALCLDECQDFNFIVKCIKAGFSFVMHEGAGGEYSNGKPLSFEENISITREVVNIAHAVNVTVEASLGEMPLSESGIIGSSMEKTNRTDPDQAYEFVQRTGIDILAPSIGNIHCLYKDKWPEPDWILAEKIVRRIGIPCSLHGASGARDEQIRKAISIGFKKINIGTRYNEIYRKALLEELQKCEGLGCPFNSSNVAANTYKKEAKRLMREVYESSQMFKSDSKDYWTVEKIDISPVFKSNNAVNNDYNYLISEITEKVLKNI